MTAVDVRTLSLTADKSPGDRTSGILEQSNTHSVHQRLLTYLITYDHTSPRVNTCQQRSH